MNRSTHGLSRTISLVTVLLVSLVLLSSGRAVPGIASTVPLGFDSAEQWESWRDVTFPDIRPTEYTFHENETMVCGRADASASGTIKEFPGKLTDHPILSWEWRIDGVLESGDARVKEGDDYAARVYVNFERDDRLGWWERTRASLFESIYGQEIPGQSLNFVWANRLEAGEVIPSAYTEHSRLIALQSGNGQAGEWVREEVNLLDQYERAFPDQEPPPVHSVAIMVDSDDTGESARGCFQNLTLSSTSGENRET